MASRVKRVTAGRVLSSLWLAWVVVTAGSVATSGGSWLGAHSNVILNAVFQVFTPLLPAKLSVPAVLLVLPALWVANRLGTWLTPALLRVLWNLVVLLLLTLTTDSIAWRQPRSLNRVIEVYGCFVTRPQPKWCR